MIKQFIDFLLGLRWGDEGKGKWASYLLCLFVKEKKRKYKAIVKANGGSNSGHTQEHEGKKFVGHILPSGALFPWITLLIGGGVVFDPVKFKKERDELKKMGIDISNRIFIAHNTILASPFEPFIDKALEYCKSGEKIGTTGSGIGPALASDKYRNGLRMFYLFREDFTAKKNELFKMQKNLLLKFYDEYGYKADINLVDHAETLWIQAIEEISAEWICDMSEKIMELSEDGDILVEGSQGFMLDVDWGDYPFVTSSSTIPTVLCSSLGIPHTAIRNVYGVIKPYETKVGGGPFPYRMDAENEELFRKAANEFGATTGRPRSCGWLDIPTLNRAIKITGTNKIFISKMDICPVEKMKVFVGCKKDYMHGFSEITVGDLVSEEVPGWKNDTPVANLLHHDNFINRISGHLKTDECRVEIVAVGTGPNSSDYKEVFI